MNSERTILRTGVAHVEIKKRGRVGAKTATDLPVAGKDNLPLELVVGTEIGCPITFRNWMVDGLVVQVRSELGCVANFRQQAYLLRGGDRWTVSFNDLDLLVQFCRILLGKSRDYESRKEKYQGDQWDDISLSHMLSVSPLFFLFQCFKIG